ncbi:substrate-binding periplasmic protein [Winogradskyella aurantiaca]|uniref:substrate-binding periplasmic protein n=1 Tax=Winogradskyella aurantiaca TaxID=2219558 RepID=UPI000E1CB05D|nr:transporter substrate-binding domain-containing protein [Winogradskyella aurantiaca]
MTRKLLTALIIILGINSYGQSSLNLGSDVWPPFTNEGSERSIAFDIVKEGLARNSVGMQAQLLGFKEVLSGIEEGNFDGSAALWKTEEREEIMIFSEPYLENRLILVGLKGTEVNYQSIEELKNQRLGVVANYAYEADLLNADNVQLVYGKSDQDNLEKLFDNKIDFMLVDELLIQYLLKYQYNDVQTYLNIAEQAFQTQKLYLALRKDVPNAQSIIDGFNTSIKEMMLDGTYNRILDLDILQLDVNGDGVVELIFNGKNLSEDASEKSYSIFYYDRSDKKRTQYYMNGKSYTSINLMKKNIGEVESIRADNANYDSGLKIKF